MKRALPILLLLLASLTPFTLGEGRSLYGRLDRGLAYLAGQQQEDGSWRSLRYPRNTGIASLALLAFLATGNLPDEGEYGDIVRRGLDFVLKSGEEDGFLVASSSHGPMYEHALSTLLLAEVWGTVPDPRIERRLRAAVQRILEAQNDSGGWRYYPTSRDADLSVTAAQVLALRSAQNAGLKIPQRAIQRAVAYIKRCAVPGGGFAYMPGDVPTFTRTAMGSLALMLCGEFQAPEVRAAVRVLQQSPGGDKAYPYYGYYYATQVMFQEGGDAWEGWYAQVRDWLLQHQNPDGSWTGEIGRTYGTALAILTLAVPLQYLPITDRWKGPHL